MNMRNDWTIADNYFDPVFYSKEETIQNVRENFDLRRYNTSEGYDIEINGIIERCLVQTSSNPLRELNDYRKIQCPITADIKRGYYVRYEGSIWIIDTNVLNVDGAYLSAKMSRCQCCLRWQNDVGKIVQRWAYAVDQTKYSSGESGTGVVTIGDNQYGLLIPIDSETKKLKRGMRFSIDFDDSNEPDIYRLTNRKVKISDETYFDRGGIMHLTLSYDTYNADTDKRIELSDGHFVWIADYHAGNVEGTGILNPSTFLIKGDRKIKIGFAKTYTISTDESSHSIDGLSFNWDIISSFNDKVEAEEVGSSIKIKITDQTLIGETLTLQLSYGNKIVDSLVIDICSIYG